MASWSEIEEAAPLLAERARGCFDVHIERGLSVKERE